MPGIPTIYSISTMIIQCGLVVALIAVFFICGQTFDWYLLQIPVAMVPKISCM